MIIEMTAKPFDEQPELTFDEIVKGEVEYSQWRDKGRMLWVRKI